MKHTISIVFLLAFALLCGCNFKQDSELSDSPVDKNESQTITESITTTQCTTEQNNQESVLTEEDLILKYINLIKQKAQRFHNIKVMFYDVDNDGVCEMLPEYDGYSYDYDIDNDSVFRNMDCLELGLCYKYRTEDGREFFAYKCDSQAIYYFEFNNGKLISSDFLFDNAYFDNRKTKEITYFYSVSKFASAGLQTKVDYISNPKIQDKDTKDVLVSKETYEKAVEEFNRTTIPVPITVKSFALTEEEINKLGTEEILKRIVEETRVAEFPTHTVGKEN